MTGKQYIYIVTEMVRLQTQAFLNLLDRNHIEYNTIGYQDPLIEQFPEIQEEIKLMVINS
jgi:hypothetical protein